MLDRAKRGNRVKMTVVRATIILCRNKHGELLGLALSLGRLRPGNLRSRRDGEYFVKITDGRMRTTRNMVEFGVYKHPKTGKWLIDDIKSVLERYDKAVNMPVNTEPCNNSTAVKRKTFTGSLLPRTWGMQFPRGMVPRMDEFGVPISD